MKVIYYSTRKGEKEPMNQQNSNRHDIVFTSRVLGTETTSYATGMEAVIVFTNDTVTAPIIQKLSALGVRYIVSRSVGVDHIDRSAAQKYGIEITNIPQYSPQAIAQHVVALALALSRHLVQANRQCLRFNFSLDNLTGFNLYGKTVGILGLGHIGKAAVPIFNGLGCKAIGYDILYQDSLSGVDQVDLDTLYKESDVITIHIPLNDQTKYIINRESIGKMKTGVMIINTARGGLVKTTDALEALRSGKIGYLGLDVYSGLGKLGIKFTVVKVVDKCNQRIC